MEGTFQGDLISTGRVVVAPTGKIKGDLKGLKFLLVEGQVRHAVWQAEGRGARGVEIYWLICQGSEDSVET